MIYDCIFRSAVPLNNRQISQLTGIAINAVSGRVWELLESKRVRKVNDEKDPVTQKTVRFVEAVVPQPFQRRIEWPG